MRFYSGDIVYIKNIVFSENRPDHSTNGRPCVVLYSSITEEKGEEVFFLPMTSKLCNLKEHNEDQKYLIFDCNTQTSLIDISEIHSTNNLDDISDPVVNINKDIFRIINHTIKYHRFDRKEKNIKCLIVLEYIKSMEKELSKKLSVRRKKIKKQKEEFIPKKQINISIDKEEARITKKLIKRKNFKNPKEEINNYCYFE